MQPAIARYIFCTLETLIKLIPEDAKGMSVRLRRDLIQARVSARTITRKTDAKKQ